MRADSLGRQEAAVERHHRIGQTRCLSFALDPACSGKFIAILAVDATAEAVGDIGLIVAKNIYAERTVLKDSGGRPALVVDAHQHRWVASIGGYG